MLFRSLDYPKGHPSNPLTTTEIEQKFDALAAPVMSSGRRQQIKDAVWNLENLDTVRDLTELLRVDGVS